MYKTYGCSVAGAPVLHHENDIIGQTSPSEELLSSATGYVSCRIHISTVRFWAYQTRTECFHVLI